MFYRDMECGVNSSKQPDKLNFRLNNPNKDVDRDKKANCSKTVNTGYGMNQVPHVLHIT